MPKYCLNEAPSQDIAFGVWPRCALPPGHDGPHQTIYGRQWDNKGKN